MTDDEIEDLAFEGAELPVSLQGGDLLLFLLLRSLYSYARQVQMPREQGVREKAKILDTVRRWRSKEQLIRHCAELHKAAEAGSTAFRKAETPEAAIDAARRLIEALDRVPVTTAYERAARS